MGWTNPSQVANKTCVEEKESEIAENVMKHGEICREDKHCFNHAKGAFCDRNNTEVELGACVSPLSIGDACSRNAHKECPAQSYCSSDRKCVAARTTGQECDSSNFCQFGLICIASDAELKNHTCHAPGSIGDNQLFLDDDIADVDQYFGVASSCFEHTFNDTDQSAKKICRRGNVSKDTSKGALRRNSPDEICEFTTFLGNQTVGEEGKVVNETAQCGFNKNSDAWCRKRKGDQWFQKAFKAFTETDFSGFNCHVQSSAKMCLAAFYTEGKEVFYNFDRALMEVDEEDGFSRFAMNDKCVAESVTANFWRGNNPDSAFGYSLFAVFALVLSATSLL